ncbi:probable DNA damage tolerance protein RHC31 [Nakaseomyces glabratus]|nr:ThiF family [Nakaseomyces glabratus]QNG14125.1 uncharacterized protein GWK60_G09603 [Nakaseomyces glabratus]SCV14396.1 probable DNA damage tolerance protein RHC31 [Nakaseomyces glabratus]SLM13069.1 probable DNA damage tolerance protein RHC31 [Nakaseomyces glabratus]
MEKLSEDEIALYDRQIRLWGLAAQTNMRIAKVLLVNIGSIGTEVAKNIVLSGIGHLTVLDSHIVNETDLGSQFFLTANDVGKKRVEAVSDRLQDMNPRVNLVFDSADLKSKTDDFYKQFNIIIGTELDFFQRESLNSKCRALNIPLYLTGSNGMFAYIFVDLISFDAVDEKIHGNTSGVKLGSISERREIIKIDEREDDDRVMDIITTRNTYLPLYSILKSATLNGLLTNKQKKRATNILPLTFTQLKLTNPTNTEQFKEELLKTCKQLGLEFTTIKDDYLEQFIKQQGVEFTPVASVIGGAVAQDVINILGKRQSPLNNFIVFDGITLDMPIFEF